MTALLALLAILACVEFPFALLGAAVVTHAVWVRLEHRRTQQAADAHLAALRKGREVPATLLGEARAWIDKHRCCTEERRALIARIDAILSPRADAPRET